MKTHWFAIVLGTLVLAPVAAWGDEPTKEPTKDEPKHEPMGPPASLAPGATAPAPGQGAPEADPSLPSLDQMLGLEDETDAETKKLLEDYDPDKVQLERMLTAKEAAEKLEQAVQQMHESAFRLEEIRDAGIVTQRLQAEVLTKLDVLIKSAEQQQQSGSKGQSSGQQQQQQQSDQQMPKKGDQQNAQQTPSTNPGNEYKGGPAFKEGQRDQFEAARAAWGALPERIRDRLFEGSSDQFSEWYKELTAEYYKRIADEAKKR